MRVPSVEPQRRRKVGWEEVVRPPSSITGELQIIHIPRLKEWLMRFIQVAGQVMQRAIDSLICSQELEAKYPQQRKRAIYCSLRALGS